MDVEKLIREAVEAEREACARIAETMDYSEVDFGPMPDPPPQTDGARFWGNCTFDNRGPHTPARIAEAIRSRSLSERIKQEEEAND